MSTSVRKITSVWRSQPTMEGAGVRLRRAFGFGETPNLDPYLLLDNFHSADPSDYKRGFPWHPHRGMETITYVLDGEVEHGDSLGNGGIIAAGDVQWMTAGSGIVHQEMPRGNRKGEMWGMQLWANLPASRKMTDPRYQEFKSADIPSVKTVEGVTVRVISGVVEGHRGPVQNVAIDPQYLDVSVPAGKTFRYPVPSEHTVFAFVIEGEGYFDDEPHHAGGKSGLHNTDSLIVYGLGDEIHIRADKRSVRFLLVTGKPIGEPVAWYGPIVMNTEAELKTAFEEYQAGTFLKHAQH